LRGLPSLLYRGFLNPLPAQLPFILPTGKSATQQVCPAGRDALRATAGPLPKILARMNDFDG
jgi:hypothetical protein